MSAHTALVLAALVVIVLGCTQLPHIWREVTPEPELELGWWLPDTGLSTPAAVETRVRERNVRQWLQVVLGTTRQTDETGSRSDERLVLGVDPGLTSDVVCLASQDSDGMIRVLSIEEVPHETDREREIREFIARHRNGFPLAG